MTNTNILIVVAKRPNPGQTKTRLVPPLLPEQAAALYECFLLDTLSLMKKTPSVQLVIAFSPESERNYFEKLAHNFELLLQEGPDLGARLDHALQYYLKRGRSNVVIMDSDSPTLPSVFLATAFTALSDGSDVVLGPCDDGGYYLIGMKQPAPRLLLEVQMSTPNVTKETLNMAVEEGLSVSLLPTWYDIDEINTLMRLQKELSETENVVAPNTRAFLSDPEIKNRIFTYFKK